MTRTCAARSVGAIVISAVIVASSVILHANGSAFEDFCHDWEFMLDEPDDLWCFENPEFRYTGGYDISSMQDDEPLMLQTAAEICDDATFSCWDTCDSEDYAEWALEQVNQAAWPNCEYDISCIETWTSSQSCTQGATGDFSCGCSYMNVCSPC